MLPQDHKETQCYSMAMTDKARGCREAGLGPMLCSHPKCGARCIFLIDTNALDGVAMAFLPGSSYIKRRPHIGPLCLTVHVEIITAIGEKCCFGSDFLKFSSSSPLSYPPTQYPLNVCDSGHLHVTGTSCCFGLHEKRPTDLAVFTHLNFNYLGDSTLLPGENNSWGQK